MKTNPFYRSFEADAESIVEACCVPETGRHRFFRTSGTAMQRRFAELVEHDALPRILIHGNPHIANYCRTRRGTAMVDFDRSRVGPYAYDLVRFLISASLCREHEDDDLLHPTIVEQFRRGYLFGQRSRRHEYEEMIRLRDAEVKWWQTSTDAYLAKGKKWARRLDEFSVRLKKKHRHLLLDYLQSRDEGELLKRYRIEKVAEVPGSMGKMHFVFHLVDNKQKSDSILIDIKETYVERDSKWYTNPFEHQGVRMNAAAEFYAPDWEQRPGHASYKGRDYWGRQIPLQQVKPKAPLSDLDLCDLCFAVASQLGWGHARAASKSQRAEILSDFEARWDEYVQAAKQMRLEMLDAHRRYLIDVHESEQRDEYQAAANC